MNEAWDTAVSSEYFFATSLTDVFFYVSCDRPSFPIK